LLQSVFEGFGTKGIDLESTSVSVHDIKAVAELLCSAGVLVKVPNLLNEIEDVQKEIFKGYKTYIVNPSLTCQFIKTVFPNYNNMNSILGLVYEANCMVDLYYKKQAADEIYYIESKEVDNYEIDIAIVGNDNTKEKQFYLFECKHSYKVNVYNENWSIVNGRVDKVLKEAFPDSEVCGRFIIHPGEKDVQTHHSGRKVVVVNQNEDLYRYYDFDKLCHNDILIHEKHMKLSEWENEIEHMEPELEESEAEQGLDDREQTDFER